MELCPWCLFRERRRRRRGEWGKYRFYPCWRRGSEGKYGETDWCGGYFTVGFIVDIGFGSGFAF